MFMDKLAGLVLPGAVHATIVPRGNLNFKPPGPTRSLFARTLQLSISRNPTPPLSHPRAGYRVIALSDHTEPVQRRQPTGADRRPGTAGEGVTTRDTKHTKEKAFPLPARLRPFFLCSSCSSWSTVSVVRPPSADTWFLHSSCAFAPLRELCLGSSVIFPAASYSFPPGFFHPQSRRSRRAAFVPKLALTFRPTSVH
jgi:hypothetical protein